MEVGDDPAPVVPTSVKAPVVAATVYSETPPELVTYAKLPEGWITIGPATPARVPVDVRAPVVLLMAYIEMSFEPEFAT